MTTEANDRKYIIHPGKFNLWLFIVSIILLFGALTSAYIVSKGIESDKDMWHYFEMPTVLWLNSAILVVASVVLQVGLWGARKGDFRRAKIGYGLTLLLGVFFLVGQFVAWSVLADEGIVFGGGGSNSGNYLYVLTCLHGLHIVAGIVFLGVVYWKLMMNRYRVGQLLGLENAATFWHFLGLLWLYLFIFLLLNQGTPIV